MEFIKIIKDIGLSYSITYIRTNEIKSVELYFGPHFIEIYYQDKMISGYVRPDFDIVCLMAHIGKNEYFLLDLHEEMFPGDFKISNG